MPVINEDKIQRTITKVNQPLRFAVRGTVTSEGPMLSLVVFGPGDGISGLEQGTGAHAGVRNTHVVGGETSFSCRMGPQPSKIRDYLYEPTGPDGFWTMDQRTSGPTASPGASPLDPGAWSKLETVACANKPRGRQHSVRTHRKLERHLDTRAGVPNQCWGAKAHAHH